MKTLREFLIAEAKEDKTNEKIPEGFSIIKSSGGLTGAAKEAMGGSFKAGLEAASSSKGKQKIIDQLKGTGSDTIKSIITSVVKTKNDLDEVFIEISSKSEEIIGDKDGVVIKLNASEWPTLAGREKSSLRLLKFWLYSTLLAYGYQKKGVVFAISDKKDSIVVCN